MSMTATAEVQEDKIKHAGVSMVIGASAEAITENVLQASTICMAVGTAKEVYDELDYGGFSTGDLIADAIGCAIGISGVKLIQVYQDNDALGVSFNYNF